MTLNPKNRTRAVVAALVAVTFALGPAAALPFPALPPTPSSVGAAVPFQAAATLYQEDFEFSDGGYTTGGSASWQYGSPVSPPTPVAGQGPSMWGTNLVGDYANGECGYLEAPAIDLSTLPAGASTGASVARLAFRHWMHVENRFDAGLVMASSDGANWAPITPVGGYPAVPLTSARACMGLDADGRAFTTPSTAPAVDAWTLAEFDVTGYLGGALHVRWVFASDSSVVKRGWYVDDVLVQVGAGAAASVPVPGAETGDVGVAFTPATTLYAEDFEATDGGWTSAGVWEWGATSAPPVPGAGSLSVWGTHLLGDYLPNECAALTSPTISIPGAPAAGAQAAQLSFKLWRHLENGYDGAIVQASTDGANWRRLAPVDGYDRALTSSLAASTRACLGVTAGETVWSGPASAPRDDEWLDVAVDVTSLMGSDAQFRFVFGSEAAGEARGVYVDDVVVQLGAGASVAKPDGSPSLPSPLWTVTGSNPSWEFGFVNSPTSRTPVWATNLDGHYNNNECSAIESTEIDTNAIPGVGRLELSFQHSFVSYSTSTLDGGIVQVSRDGGATWSLLNPIGGYGSTLTGDARNCLYGGDLASPGWRGNVASGWEDVRASLSSYQGDSIRLRFAFGSSPSGTDQGWAIRSVALSRGAGSVPLGMTLDTEGAKKFDDALLGAVRDGQDSFRVIVTGQEHEGVADLGFATRAEYTAWFETKAAPFLDALAARVALAGGSVDHAWALLPGAAVTVDLHGLLALAAMEEVRYVTLDRDDAVRLIDPIADESVGAMNTQGRQQLQAEDIWALGYTGAGITVTVIDTGIDPSHEAFKNADGSSRVAMFANCVDGTCDDTAPAIDDHGHGTHVAGTAVGSSTYVDPTHGAFQETGVAPAARLTVGKFLSGSGSGSFAGAIDTLSWSFNVAQADLTSNSWGASGCSSSAWPVMQAVRTTTDAGMLNVFAAGNSGPGSGTIGSPGCSESALTVGAIDVNKAIASFSSRGPCSDTEIGGASRVCPDVVAKGVAVRSAIPRSGAGNADPSGYKTWQGTSMATPHIAGAVILAEQMKRALTGTGWDTAARAEEEVFKLTAEDLGVAGEDSTFGWGLPQLLNIYAMLDATDSARIVTTFGVSKDVLRQGDSALLSFGVRNLGGAIVAGDFVATLEDPSGAVATLRSSTVSLGLLDGTSFGHTFSVTGSVAPGTYTFRGSFDYSWTNSTSGEVVTELIEREATIDVKRVFVQTTMAGLDERTTPGDLQVVTYSATNSGNEDAQKLVIEVTVPDDYVFVPGQGFDPTNPLSRYSSPAPSRVVEDSKFGRVTLVYDVGALPQDASFGFTTQLLPTMPGTYNFLSVAKWEDGAGTKFSQGSVLRQVVGAP